MSRAAVIVLLSVAAALPRPAGTAPAPRPRPGPGPRVTAGEYLLYWNGAAYRVRFGADGYYHCRNDSAVVRDWVGSWRWSEAKGQLEVEERQVFTEYQPAVNRWHVTLDDRWRGTVASGPYTGIKVRLVPRGK